MRGRLLMRTGVFGPPVPTAVSALMRELAADQERLREPMELDDETISLAVAEGLGPLLGAWLAADRIVVPEKRRDALVWERQVCLAANLIRRKTIEMLVRVYQERSIPLVLLKGMALIQDAFDPGERSMSDIDVLVPPSRWQEACILAMKEGFQKEALPGRGYTIDHDYVRSFTTPGGAVVEIHRYICERSLFAIDYEGADGIFARARQLPSGALLPGEGDLFLTLVAHAAKHTLELPLRSFADGIVLLRTLKVANAGLRERARQWGMEAALDAWMLVLKNLQGTSGAGDATNGDGGSAAALGKQWGRFVWTKTGHASPWQRFIRLAWLTDSIPQWAGHVATRLAFRIIDASLMLWTGQEVGRDKDDDGRSSRAGGRPSQNPNQKG